jgi:hypothetical protein
MGDTAVIAGRVNESDRAGPVWMSDGRLSLKRGDEGELLLLLMLDVRVTGITTTGEALLRFSAFEKRAGVLDRWMVSPGDLVSLAKSTDRVLGFRESAGEGNFSSFRLKCPKIVFSGSNRDFVSSSTDDTGSSP